VALVGVLVATSGVVYGVPLGGVGGFTIEAEERRGEGMSIYPGVEETSEDDAYPVGVTEIQHAEVTGPSITKEMDASPLPGLDGTMRVVIYSGSNETVRIDQQMLKYSRLRAEKATFSGEVYDEYNREDPSEQFDITAPADPQEGRTISATGDEPGVVLRDVEVQAHYTAASSVEFSKLNVDVEYESGDGADVEEPDRADEGAGETP
jgi:hypothetical protein